MIKITNLSLQYQQQKILNQINLHIPQKQIVAIIGASGAGKSTLLRCLNLLAAPQEGIIEIDDLLIDVTKTNEKQLIKLRQSTAMVFQQFNLFPYKTALENVMEALIIVKKQPKKLAKIVALEQLKNVGLADKANHYPKHLSGGQQQRVAIARALAMQPKVVLLDEPTSALDPQLVAEVLESIKRAADAGFTMLLVSHEINFVKQVADRVLFLHQGQIIDDGSPQQVINYSNNPIVNSFFSNTPDYTI